MAAEDFGAKCRRSLASDVTHMVAAGPGTAKAEEAYRRGDVHVVFPSWLNDTLCRWQRQDEAAYRVPRSDRLASLGKDALHDLANSVHTDPEGADEAALENLANMDWGEAEDEVEAFLDEDEDEESDTSQSVHSDVSDAVRSQDARDMGHEESDPDLLRSPLSRRRQAAAQRSGSSKLRQSVVADESDTDDSPAPTPKRRRTQSRVEQLRSHPQQTPPDSEEEHFLDDFALEMERELGDDL